MKGSHYAGHKGCGRELRRKTLKRAEKNKKCRRWLAAFLMKALMAILLLRKVASLGCWSRKKEFSSKHTICFQWLPGVLRHIKTQVFTRGKALLCYTVRPGLNGSNGGWRLFCNSIINRRCYYKFDVGLQRYKTNMNLTCVRTHRTSGKNFCNSVLLWFS